MMVLKACPRCHGDLAADCDRRAAFLYCVQCGHTLTAAQERALGVHATRRGVVHLAAIARRAPAPSEAAAASR